MDGCNPHHQVKCLALTFSCFLHGGFILIHVL